MEVALLEFVAIVKLDYHIRLDMKKQSQTANIG
jgi:hypothetical protein